MWVCVCGRFLADYDDLEVEEDPEAMESYRQRLEPFLLDDDLALRRVPIYRRPSERNGTVEQNTKPVAAKWVRGFVIHVSRLNRSMGPVYTIEWEDNLRETDILQRVMKDMLIPEPNRMGHGTPLGDEVVEFLEEASEIIGGELYAMRRRNYLARAARFCIVYFFVVTSN